MKIMVKPFGLRVSSATEAPKQITVEGECEVLRIGQDGQVLVDFQGHSVWVRKSQIGAPQEIQTALWVTFEWNGRDLYHPKMVEFWDPGKGGTPYKLAAQILGAYITAVDSELTLSSTPTRGRPRRA